MSWCRECDKPNRVKTAAVRRKAGVRPLANWILDALWMRQGGRCGICNRRMIRGLAEIDHKRAIANGGRHEASNLQWTHRACNRSKSCH